MSKAKPTIRSEAEQPIFFRTTSAHVYESTLKTGSLWLRSDQYYRNLEDKIRSDPSEGINSSRLALPLRFEVESGPFITIQGSGEVGQQIVPHYVLSLHGTSITSAQLASFGGYTFGIKCLSSLSAEILDRASSLLECDGCRFGQVSYKYPALAVSRSHVGAAIGLSEFPPMYLNAWSTDVLRKQPTKPFIEQDEWRIVIFTKGYLNANPHVPLQINVTRHISTPTPTRGNRSRVLTRSTQARVPSPPPSETLPRAARGHQS